LEEGQCIIRVNSIKDPFLLNIPLVKRKFLTVTELQKTNDEILKQTGSNLEEVNITTKKDNLIREILQDKGNPRLDLVSKKTHQNTKRQSSFIPITEENLDSNADQKEFLNYLDYLIKNSEKNE
jgi:hypothetical protein